MPSPSRTEIARSVRHLTSLWEHRTLAAVSEKNSEYHDADHPSRDRRLGRAGLPPKVGIELEAFVLEPDGAGGSRPWNTLL